MFFNTVSVGTTPTLIVPANAQRLSLIVVNTSSGTVYLGQDTTVTTSNGIPMLQNQNLTEDSGGTKMYCGPIYGIVASSTSDVRAWERTR